jgi:putative FmdB family regulatory protein
MPVYEYACQSCGASFERFHKSLHAREPIQCPQCSSEAVERKLSVFAAHDAASSTACAAASAYGPAACERCGNPDGPCRL